MRIGLDIDGVLADIETPLEEILTNHFGEPPMMGSNHRFYMHERYNVDAKAMDKIIIDIFNDPNFWESAKPIKENVLATRLAAANGHQIVWITGRQNNARQATHNWSQAWYVPMHELLMDCKQEKHRAMRYTGCEFLVEDRYEEAATVALKGELHAVNGQGFRSYLLRRPYNIMHEGQDDGVIWANDLNEIFVNEGLI